MKERRHDEVQARPQFDYSKQIERGAAFMDAYKPGWDLDISERKLDLANPNVCVLGQTFDGHYREGKAVLRAAIPWHKKFFLTHEFIASRHGFQLPVRHRITAARRYAFSRLTEQWLDFIHARHNLVVDVAPVVDEATTVPAGEEVKT